MSKQWHRVSGVAYLAGMQTDGMEGKKWRFSVVNPVVTFASLPSHVFTTPKRRGVSYMVGILLGSLHYNSG